MTPSSLASFSMSALTESFHLVMATVKATSQQALASTSSLQAATASAIDSSLVGITVSMTVVVPPAKAALVPLVKSSASGRLPLPRNWVQVSTPPGMTNLSVASMTLAPEGTSRSWPTSLILPSSTITSAFSVVLSLTTVPPLIRMLPDSWVKKGTALTLAASTATQGSSTTSPPSPVSSGEGGVHMMSLI